MPLLPVLHGPASSKKNSSANSSPRLSPHDEQQQHHQHRATLSSRPLLKKYHSSPIAPSFKSLASASASASSGSGSGSSTPKLAHSRQGSGSNLAIFSSPKEHPKPRAPPPPPPQIQMSFNIESPPLVLYGTPQESTGALLSGLFQLHVLNTSVAMKKAHLAVVQKVTSKKQVPTNPHGTNSHHHTPHRCTGCATATSELARWDVLPGPTTLPKQTHGYPFSHLLPGSLPASANNSLFSVEYFLVAEAHFEDASLPPHVLSKPLKISRSIVRSADRNSVRVFPPTALTASVSIPSVVYPNSQFSFEMALEGISLGSSNNANNGKTRWRMRKINWRVDEVMKMKPHACATHNPDGDKPVAQETRTIGSGEFKTGWKTDFSDKGRIDLSGFDISTHAANVCCNIDDPTLGLSVNHLLVVELVVAEETITQKSASRQAVPTGAARVLRMQFNLVITERSGLGIAWDDEVPPTYADVPLSPPEYNEISSLPNVEDVSPDTYATGYVEGINERLALSQL